MGTKSKLVVQSALPSSLVMLRVRIHLDFEFHLLPLTTNRLLQKNWKEPTKRKRNYKVNKLHESMNIMSASRNRSDKSKTNSNKSRPPLKRSLKRKKRLWKKT